MQIYQVQVGGQTFGAGTDAQLTGITGLRSAPPLRSGNIGRGGVDGNFPGFNYLDARVFTVTYHVIAPTAAPETVLQNLARAHANIVDPSTVATTPGRYLTTLLGGNTLAASVMLIQLPGRTYPLACFGRPTNYALDTDLEASYNSHHVAAEWTVDDGAVYDYNPTIVSCGLPSTTAGMTFNTGFNLVFGASSGGSVTYTNTGNYQTWPVIKITGPCQYPVVTLNTTGAYLGLGLTLGVTDTVIIDMFAGTVTLNGTGMRNNVVLPGSSFWALGTGAQSIGFGTSDAVAPAAIMTVAAMPAWAAV